MLRSKASRKEDALNVKTTGFSGAVDTVVADSDTFCASIHTFTHRILAYIHTYIKTPSQWVSLLERVVFSSEHQATTQPFRWWQTPSRTPLLSAVEKKTCRYIHTNSLSSIYRTKINEFKYIPAYVLTLNTPLPPRRRGQVH